MSKTIRMSPARHSEFMEAHSDLLHGVHRSFEVAYAHPGTGRANYWAARRRFKLRHLRLRRRMSRVRELELGLDRTCFACLSYRLSDDEIVDDVAERLGVRYNWGTHSAMPN